MKRATLLFYYLVASSTFLLAQNPIQVGSGSYAEYPTSQAAAIDFYGSTYNNKIKDPAPYYVHQRMYGQPIPTNDWTTDCFFSQFAGRMWAYPHAVSADNQGANIIFPSGILLDQWGSQVANETPVLEVVGDGFTPISALAYDWNDIGFTMQSHESETEYINVTMGHGMPFVWSEYVGITTPQIRASNTTPVIKDINGNSLVFPATISVFTLTYDGVTFGVHLPAGTTVTQAAGTFSFAFSGSAKYVVISMLPAENMIATFNTVARNVPRNTLFTYDYTPINGKMSTNFTLETENLDDQSAGGESILALMPHHWRNTTLNKSLISNAEYTTVFGKLKCVQGTSFQIDYTIPGMPSAMPAPNNLTPTQIDRLNQLITSRVNVSAGFNGNTYAKGLGEESTMMLIAKELGHPGFETLKSNLKAELIDWFTFSTGETTERFFAMYPEIGAYVGFAPGYGSQLMNDHNFHNGYFIAGAARLMLVDPQFKAQYGEITKKIAKSYANWLRYGVNDNDFLPFFRSFDPYTGHSWAGGLSSDEGPNQESTSESTNSWFALYTLGIALDDPEIINAGVMGFTLEGKATMEYWFDAYNENYLPNYKEYTGIVFAGRLAYGTWFSGDPGWIFGIQTVPNDSFYQYYMNDAASLGAKWNVMLQDRANSGDHTSADAYENVADMGEYLGGYHLNYVAAFNPEYAAELLDDLMTNEGGAWLTGVNAATTMFTANASVSYGLPANGYTTNDYTSGVFYKVSTDTYAYISSNYTDDYKAVVVYNNGVPIGHFIAVPNDVTVVTQLQAGIPPTIQITSLTDNQNYDIGSDIVIDVDAQDPDGSITEVQLWIDGILESIDSTAPYTFTLENVEESAFTVRAVAVDNDDLESKSKQYYLTVGNIPPSISITNPFSGTKYFVGDDVDITANASDEDGSIAFVTFYDNGVELSVDNDVPYTHSLVDLVGGNHSLLAKATDNEGKEVFSEQVNIVALDLCSGAPVTKDLGRYTYTISSATPNSRITYIPAPGNPVLFCEVQYSVNGTGQGGHGMTLQADGSYTFNITAGDGSVVAFRFVNNLFVGENFTHTIGENCGSNIPPVANAGADFSAKVTAPFILIDGSDSMDWDGTIVAYQWSKISGPNATLINQNMNVLRVENLEMGSYVFQLSVTDDDAAQSTDQVMVTVSEVLSTNTEIMNSNRIKLFPNPVIDNITIDTSNKAFNKIKLFDITGKLLKSFDIKSNELFQFNMSKFQAGVYIFEFSNNSEKQFVKIIKQ